MNYATFAEFIAKPTYEGKPALDLLYTFAALQIFMLPKVHTSSLFHVEVEICEQW